MKLLFVCRKFDRMAGGVERMATRIMAAMVERGMAVHLLTWDDAAGRPHYRLPEEVVWTKLAMGDPDQAAGWRLRLARLARFRKLLRAHRPDLVIAFQSGAFQAIAIAALGLGLKIIAAERNAPDLYRFRSNGRWLEPLTNISFLLAWRITVQWPSFIDRYPSWLRAKMVVIPNPVFAPKQPAFPNEAGEPPKLILCLGRLSYQKNQAFLLRAFKLIAADFPQWRLALVGGGEQETYLKALTAELSLEHQVVFAGVSHAVDDWYARAAFLAFPSLWEGFPNAVAEAFGHGLPVIGARETAGVNELIEDGVNGILTSLDKTAFAAAMARLMRDRALRARLGRAASQSILRFQPDAVFETWAGLFRKAGTAG